MTFWILWALGTTAALVGLWHARPRGPWPIDQRKIRYAFVTISADIAAFTRAMVAAAAKAEQLLTVYQGRYAGASASAGTHRLPSSIDLVYGREGLREPTFLERLEYLEAEYGEPGIDAARWRPDIEGAP